MELTNSAEAASRRRRRRSRASRAGLSFSASLPLGIGGVYADSILAVTCSENPLADFRQSIAEMATEVGVTSWEEMEELVHCYLVLNSSDVHGLIEEAFLSLCSPRTLAKSPLFPGFLFCGF